MILAILGLIDMVAGGMLIIGKTLGLQGSSLIFYFFVFFLVKGLYSVGTAFAAGFFMDLLGFIDLATAAFLLFSFWGLSLGFVFWVGILMVLKGMYSFVMYLVE